MIASLSSFSLVHAQSGESAGLTIAAGCSVPEHLDRQTPVAMKQAVAPFDPNLVYRHQLLRKDRS